MYFPWFHNTTCWWQVISFENDRRHNVHSFVQHITNDEVEGIQLGELPV